MIYLIQNNTYKNILAPHFDIHDIDQLLVTFNLIEVKIDSYLTDISLNTNISNTPFDSILTSNTFFIYTVYHTILKNLLHLEFRLGLYINIINSTISLLIKNNFTTQNVLNDYLNHYFIDDTSNIENRIATILKDIINNDIYVIFNFESNTRIICQLCYIIIYLHNTNIKHIQKTDSYKEQYIKYQNYYGLLKKQLDLID